MENKDPTFSISLIFCPYVSTIDKVRFIILRNENSLRFLEQYYQSIKQLAANQNDHRLALEIRLRYRWDFNDDYADFGALLIKTKSLQNNLSTKIIIQLYYTDDFQDNIEGAGRVIEEAVSVPNNFIQEVRYDLTWFSPGSIENPKVCAFLSNAVAKNRKLNKLSFIEVSLDNIVQFEENLSLDPTSFQNLTQVEFQRCEIYCDLFPLLSKTLPGLKRIDFKACSYCNDDYEEEEEEDPEYIEELDNQEEKESYNEEQQLGYQDEFGYFEESDYEEEPGNEEKPDCQQELGHFGYKDESTYLEEFDLEEQFDYGGGEEDSNTADESDNEEIPVNRTRISLPHSQLDVLGMMHSISVENNRYSHIMEDQLWNNLLLVSVKTTGDGNIRRFICNFEEDSAREIDSNDGTYEGNMTIVSGDARSPTLLLELCVQSIKTLLLEGLKNKASYKLKISF